MVNKMKPHIVHEQIHIRKARGHYRKRSYIRKAHMMTTKDGKRISIPRQVIHIKKLSYARKPYTERREELRYGGHFDSVAEKIAKGYREKGYSPEEAERIGKDTAADIYREKMARNYKK